MRDELLDDGLLAHLGRVRVGGRIMTRGRVGAMARVMAGIMAGVRAGADCLRTRLTPSGLVRSTSTCVAPG